MARYLVPGLSDGSPQEEANLEAAVLEARERWRVITLEGLETSDRRIRGVAKEAAAAHAQILDIAASSSDGSAVVIGLALALATSNPLQLTRPVGRELSREADRGAKYAAAVQRRRAATFLLPELAREFAGEQRKEPVLAIDFDENWFGEGLPDRVSLTNVSGSDLTNCTVQIDIRGRSGKWVRNVHFVPSWSKTKKMWSDYVSTDPTQLESISGTTATEVQDLKVSVWCDELRAEGIELRYSGLARDEDRARQLENLMAVRVDYVESPFLEKGPCIGVTLTGVNRLPACKVSVTCHGGNKVDQLLEMQVRGWEKHQRISLQSNGALSGCPDSVDVVLQLDGSEKTWTKNVKVSSSR